VGDRRSCLAVLVALAAGACMPSGGVGNPPTTTGAPALEVGATSPLPVGDPNWPMPAPGTCHVGQRNGQPTPDPACTPGAINPAVTQATIGQTICVSGWTATVRPSVTVTDRWKKLSAASYGTTPAGTEYDHAIPLELGGAPLDPRNLWVEPGSIPNAKDAVENRLRKQVCAGQITLAAAQAGIAADWTQFLTTPTAAPPAS
jgi:hypothetical protein